MKTLKDLAKFVERIPEEEYNQDWAGPEVTSTCGCIIYHLKVQKWFKIFDGTHTLSTYFNLTASEYHYIFGTEQVIKRAALKLGFSLPHYFKVKDAVKRIKQVIELKKSKQQENEISK